MHERGTQLFIDLESQVWDALAAGDAQADRELLSDDFIGVYPSGFATRSDHAGQLEGGPSVTSYAITDARSVDVSADAVMLCYRAQFTRPGSSAQEEMFISSLWVERHGRWLNLFSQDSPVQERG